MSPTVLTLGLLLLASPALSQASSISSPKGNSLLSITQEWSAGSLLGNLVDLHAGPGDREVRLWTGYGVTTTRGVILRQEAGEWSGWTASVVRCFVIVPLSIADTLGPASEARYRAQARAHCGEKSAPEGRVFEADTVQLKKVKLSAAPDSIWQAMIRAGLMEIPPMVDRQWIMEDGTTFVLEVRVGPNYRASVIELTTPPETETDRRIQAIAAILAPVR
jgi:hypothetical protein